MADDKIKILGQSAADIPGMISARIEEIQTLAKGLEGVFTEDIYLKEGLTQRFDEVEEQIRGFIKDAGSEFDELHAICEKLGKVVDEAAGGTSEGARKLGLELEQLTTEVTGLDAQFQAQTGQIEGALQQLNRMHDEMEDVANQRLPIVTETFEDLGAKYNTVKNATTQFNSEAKSQLTRLLQECEKQKSSMEKSVVDWGTKMDEAVDLVTDDMAANLQEADARVVELLSGVDSFFQVEVVEPTDQKAESLVGMVNQLIQMADDSITEAKSSFEWVDPTLQRIQEETNPLEALINKAQELARTFSQSAGL